MMIEISMDEPSWPHSARLVTKFCFMSSKCVFTGGRVSAQECRSLEITRPRYYYCEEPSTLDVSHACTLLRVSESPSNRCHSRRSPSLLPWRWRQVVAWVNIPPSFVARTFRLEIVTALLFSRSDSGRSKSETSQQPTCFLCIRHSPDEHKHT